jgi:hypothetical protein
MSGQGTGECRAARAARAAVAAGLLGAVLAGCGIRPTSVPVDAGAAPSRVACDLPERAGQETGTPGVAGSVRVYLVCDTRVAAVTRAGRMPAGHLAAAQALLGQLRERPEPAEAEAGFTTAVPRDLRVDGGSGGDPVGTLRLSTSPGRLPSFALAQLVCTFAGTPAGTETNGAVVLAGPAGDSSLPRRYSCTTALRSDPHPAPTAGAPA